MFTVSMGLWWAMFAVGRGSVGADSGLSLLLVGWCWAVFTIGGVVLGCCWCWWGGAGPGSSLLMLGVVMGHHLGGWWTGGYHFYD